MTRAMADPDRKAATDTAMEFAGFPHLSYVLRPEALVYQLPTEKPAELINRVLMRNARNEGWFIGVLGDNRKTIDTLMEFPIRRRSIYMYGPVGVGKTLLMCALGRLLLDSDPKPHRIYLDTSEPVEDEFKFDRTRATAIRLQRRGQARFTRIDTMVERFRDKFRGRENPVREVARDPAVVFLDEIGIDPDPTQLERHAVNHVLGERLDRMLPTVMSSNLNPSDFESMYGPRCGDRLRQCIRVEIRGPSWRG